MSKLADFFAPTNNCQPMLLYEPRNWEDFQQYFLFTPHFQEKTGKGEVDRARKRRMTWNREILTRFGRIEMVYNMRGKLSFFHPLPCFGHIQKMGYWPGIIGGRFFFKKKTNVYRLMITSEWHGINVDLVDVHRPARVFSGLLHLLEGYILSLQWLRTVVCVGERVVGIPRRANL